MGELFAVVSGKGGTGKTSLCAALATALAKEGKRVLCIDCDVGLRNLDISLGLSECGALSFWDVSEGGYSLEDAFRHPVYPALAFLTAPMNCPVEKIDTAAFGEMLSRARQMFDYVFLDAPAGVDAGFRLAAQFADRFLLVTGAGPAAVRDASRVGDLLELTPMVQSIAAVPCGVTDYRQNLFKQTPYDAETSAAVIDIMEEFGDECKRRHGKRIIYPSDEWYLKAGRPIPDPEFYEDYDQLENGVGMMSLFRQEFLAELDKPHRIYGTKKLDVVTGTMAAPLIIEMMEELHRQYPMIEVTVHPIRNKFFGGNVGVAGLVTATDIIAQCEGKLTSGTLGVPAVMLREEKDTFLDDVTITQLGERLGVKIEVLPVGGGDEARALLRSGLHIARRKR